MAKLEQILSVSQVACPDVGLKLGASCNSCDVLTKADEIPKPDARRDFLRFQNENSDDLQAKLDTMIRRFVQELTSEIYSKGNSNDHCSDMWVVDRPEIPSSQNGMLFGSRPNFLDLVEPDEELYLATCKRHGGLLRGSPRPSPRSRSVPCRSISSREPSSYLLERMVRTDR